MEKTFVLKKDTPHYKAGKLFRKSCHLGQSGYYALPDSMGQPFELAFTENIVEESPEWFTEVTPKEFPFTINDLLTFGQYCVNETFTTTLSWESANNHFQQWKKTHQ